jgi:hypothetical protein
VIKSRISRMKMAWEGKVAEAPMQQHPWSRKFIKEGDKYSLKPPKDAFSI